MVPTELVKGLSLTDSTIPDHLIKTLGSIASPHSQQVSGSNPAPFPKSHTFNSVLIKIRWKTKPYELLQTADHYA
jgi:hypothetical protein